MAGTYDSFNVNTTAPAEGADWTIASNGDGTFNFKNVLTEKASNEFYKENISLVALQTRNILI